MNRTKTKELILLSEAKKVLGLLSSLSHSSIMLTNSSVNELNGLLTRLLTGNS